MARSWREFTIAEAVADLAGVLAIDPLEAVGDGGSAAFGAKLVVMDRLTGGRTGVRA